MGTAVSDTGYPEGTHIAVVFLALSFALLVRQIRTAQLKYLELVDKGRVALFVWGIMSKLLIYNEFFGQNSRRLVVFAQFDSQRM